MRTRDIELVRHVPLFADLPPEQLPGLMASATLQRFPADTRLFEQGDRADFLHILIEGTVELSALSADGHGAVIDILTPVDSFILAAVLTDAPCLMGARVLEPARILMLPAAQLRAEIAHCPRLALAMLASMATQFRSMVKQVKELKLRTATQRLAAYLLRQRHLQHGAEGVAFSLPVSKRTLAGRLGMTPENLSRAFSTLREHGVLVHAATVTLTDLGKLAAYCQPDALIDDVEQGLTIER